MRCGNPGELNNLFMDPVAQHKPHNILRHENRGGDGDHTVNGISAAIEEARSIIQVLLYGKYGIDFVAAMQTLVSFGPVY